MKERTVIVVFPSVFSLNKMSYLVSGISNILKIKKLEFTSVKRNGFVVIVEAKDPVLASSAIGLLFGIDKIAIAKEVTNQFNEVLEAITTTSLNLLLKGDKFLVKIDGKSKHYLAKDLEVATTASLIEKSASLQVSPGTELNHNKVLYTYLTDSFAYVCIFVDMGLGGTPYNSQREKAFCCIYDELSSISSLQAIKMGFEIQILVAYSNDSDLLRLAKIISRLMPYIVREKIELQFCKLPKISDYLTKILATTHLVTSVALSRNIKRIALGISPYVVPVTFAEENARLVLGKGLIPWFSLSGIDSSILDNAEQIGLEKYLVDLKKLCSKKLVKKNITNKTIAKHVRNSMKTLRVVRISSGPRNVHDIIDSVRANH